MRVPEISGAEPRTKSATDLRTANPADIRTANSADAVSARPTPSSPTYATERNWLLGALSESEYADLAPHLQTVNLVAEQRLGPLHEDIPYVYFPQSGVVSILKRMSDGTQVEVGAIGSEGMTGLAVFLGGEQMPTECVVQIAGTANRIRPDALKEMSADGTPIRSVLLCYTQYLFDQVGQSVACSTLHSLEQRFARWMLMTRDRGGTDSFLMTHEHLATLLGVRRAGVSEAAEILKQEGGIEYSRGRVRIIDVERVEAMACECYQATRDDFDRLLGKEGRRFVLRAAGPA